MGVGGIGAGMVFALEGNHDLGRNESRPGRLLDARDYCKLHIVAHYPAVLLGARAFRVIPVGRIGEDAVGARLRREMENAGMDTRFVETMPGAPTLFSVCFQYPDGSGGNVTTSVSAAATLGAADVDRAAPLLDARTIALAVPEAPLPARLHLLALAGGQGALRVAAFTSLEMNAARDALGHVDLLAMNEDEAGALVGAPFPDGEPRAFLDRCAATVTAQGPAARIVVTAGRRGAWAFEKGRWSHSPALPVEAASTAGAGDALLGGVLTGLAVGLPLDSALGLGTAAAAFAVASPHTIPDGLTLDALMAFAARHGAPLSSETAR